MLDDDMKKLVFHSTPKPVTETAFEADGGATGTLADFKGKIALVNFWATWCALLPQGNADAGRVADRAGR